MPIKMKIRFATPNEYNVSIILKQFNQLTVQSVPQVQAQAIDAHFQECSACSRYEKQRGNREIV